MCARCKKEITDKESNWIGNHRFCGDCAAPLKNVNIVPKQAIDNTLPTTNDLPTKPYVNQKERIKVLQNCNATIIDIDRRASGREREINVLLYDKDIGYFCVRQSSGAFSGLGLWYYVLPKNISNPKIENYIDDYKRFICIPNEWFSKEFELDIHGNRRMSCGERIERHAP